MKGEMVQFVGNGSTWNGYFVPSASGSGPGVMVIQEWWGLAGHIKEVVERFAAEGFTALAPDLYKGTSTTDPDEAGTLMMALNIGETEKAMRGAVNFLAGHEATSSNKVGVVGFCMGGQLALFAGTTNENVGAVVDYYGIHPNVKPDFRNLNAPLLGFFAENDAYASQEAVAELDRTLTDLEKEHEFVTYPGTGHAFFNNDRPEVYDARAAEDSWKRMVSFFRLKLT